MSSTIQAGPSGSLITNNGRATQVANPSLPMTGSLGAGNLASNSGVGATNSDLKSRLEEMKNRLQAMKKN